MGAVTGFEWDSVTAHDAEEEAGEFSAIAAFLTDDTGHGEGVIAGTERVA